MADQATRAARFKELHEANKPFIIPNPWDAGTARILEGMGFQALATTSLGVANVLGRKSVTLDEVCENCRAICEATSLPVNADTENGFADDPEEAAKAIAAAAQSGAVGASMEDYSGNADAPIYEFELAVDRVAAAVEVAHSQPVPVLLTARAENFLHGRRDLDDTIRRLQAYEEAGADVLYAPGLKTLDEMKAVISSVSKPVNILMGIADPAITLDQLTEIGARRISIGGAMNRIALRAFVDAAQEMSEGRFEFTGRIIPLPELQKHFVD